MTSKNLRSEWTFTQKYSNKFSEKIKMKFFFCKYSFYIACPKYRGSCLSNVKGSQHNLHMKDHK